ncbi:MAG: winged helix-turn-helix domain-containing protein [Gemmatimonadota bacterium]
MLKVSFRIDLPGGERIGPGKVALLGWVDRTGSITQAAKAMKMSYRRAWLLVETLNRLAPTPMVETAHGGKRGGGAQLTAIGRKLLTRYAAMERAIDRATAMERRAVDRLLQGR